MPWRLPLWDTRPHHSSSLRTPIPDCDQRPNRGEGNAPVAAASVLSEVDGEGNIHIDVADERKLGKGHKEGEKNTEGHHRSTGTLVPIVTGRV